MTKPEPEGGAPQPVTQRANLLVLRLTGFGDQLLNAGELVF